MNRLIQSVNFATNPSECPDQSLVKTAENYIRLFKKNHFNSGLRACHMFVRKRRADLEKAGSSMPRILILSEWKAIDPDLKRVDL